MEIFIGSGLSTYAVVIFIVKFMLLASLTFIACEFYLKGKGIKVK